MSTFVTGTPGRLLEMTERTRTRTIGMCMLCKQKFESYTASPITAKWEIKTVFERHDCGRKMALRAS